MTAYANLDVGSSSGKAARIRRYPVIVITTDISYLLIFLYFD